MTGLEKSIEESRRAERVRTLIGARAIFNNGKSSVDCQIRNLSALGAKLGLSESVALPDAFVLEIPSRKKTYRAELRWRSFDAVGVEFIGIDVEESDADDLESLRAENAKLRRRVRELAERLADLGQS